MDNAAARPEASLEDILETRGAERRLVGRLLAYWHERRGERAMPSIRDIDGEGIGPDWDHCFIIDVRPDFAVPAMAHIGPVIQRFTGMLVSGRINVVLDVLDLAERKIAQARLQRGPVLVQEEFVFSDKDRLLTRGVFLPLSEDDETVTFILGAANGKVAPVVPGM